MSAIALGPAAVAPDRRAEVVELVAQGGPLTCAIRDAAWRRVSHDAEALQAAIDGAESPEARAAAADRVAVSTKLARDLEAQDGTTIRIRAPRSVALDAATYAYDDAVDTLHELFRDETPPDLRQVGAALRTAERIAKLRDRIVAIDAATDAGGAAASPTLLADWHDRRRPRAVR